MLQHTHILFQGEEEKNMPKHQTTPAVKHSQARKTARKKEQGTEEQNDAKTLGMSIQELRQQRHRVAKKVRDRPLEIPYWAR
jgi:hypothetical protein